MILDVVPTSLEHCQIIFASKQVTLTVNLSDLSQEPVEFPVGAENRKVQFSLEPHLPEFLPNQPFHFECELSDNQPEDGLNIYYARVYLKDGNRAWSSPVFVNHK